MTYAQLSRPIDWFFLGEERELAIKALGSYCKGRMSGPPEGPRFSGAYFDQLADPDHPDRFMPTDLVAVTMLSVEVPAHAAIWILDAGQQELSQLLQEVGPDRDIWEATDEELADGSPAHRLWRVLQGLPGVGVVTAGKLLAAKRPSLIPIWDSHVAAALGPPRGHFWLAMRDSLRSSTALWLRSQQKLKWICPCCESLTSSCGCDSTATAPTPTFVIRGPRPRPPATSRRLRGVWVLPASRARKPRTKITWPAPRHGSGPTDRVPSR